MCQGKGKHGLSDDQKSPVTTYCSFCSLQLGFIIPWHSTFTPAVPSLLSPTCSSVRDGWALRTERRVSQLALVRLQFCSLQERGNRGEGNALLELQRLFSERFICHGWSLERTPRLWQCITPLGSGLSRLVMLFYRCANIFYQLVLYL